MHRWCITASAASVAELQTAIEGVYALEEWHTDGKVLRPPHVEGRFILKNDTVVSLRFNHEESRQTAATQFGVGVYIIDESAFSYSYDNRALFTQTPTGIFVSGSPGFGGMRRFTVLLEGNTVRLDSGEQQFLFAPDSLAYSENGKLLRLYRRVRD